MLKLNLCTNPTGLLATCNDVKVLTHTSVNDAFNASVKALNGPFWTQAFRCDMTHTCMTFIYRIRLLDGMKMFINAALKQQGFFLFSSEACTSCAEYLKLFACAATVCSKYLTCDVIFPICLVWGFSVPISWRVAASTMSRQGLTPQLTNDLIDEVRPQLHLYSDNPRHMYYHVHDALKCSNAWNNIAHLVKTYFRFGSRKYEHTRTHHKPQRLRNEIAAI